MIVRIEVGYRDSAFDSLGMGVHHDIKEDLRIYKVDAVKVMDVYYIDSELTSDEVQMIAKDLLTDPVTQNYSVGGTLAKNFSWIVEVGYKPGVTDNVGNTAVEGIGDLLGHHFSGIVRTARQYVFSGSLTREDMELICRRLLVNPVVEYSIIHREKKPQTGYRATKPFHPEKIVEEIDLNVGDETLKKISDERLLSLTIEEMRCIRDYFWSMEKGRSKRGLGKSPTDVELEMLAQTWSEHCKHKIMNACVLYNDGEKVKTIDSLFKKYICGATEKIGKKIDWLVSVFKDNAGIIKFNEKYNLVFKVETHNHPSAIEPYGGALTGIVGVNRDPLGTGIGADLIFNTDVFCFAPPDVPDKKIPATILHPKRIFKGVRRGVEHGGNKIGIPTVNGTVVFDTGYLGNPLVFCGTGGIMPAIIRNRPTHEKTVKPGTFIVMVGGRIGKDGIHGATFSSRKLDEETPSSAVQIGAPIVQKKMQDVLLEARNRGLYTAITDNGAGGLSSSVGEMAQFSNGCRVELEKAPVKYEGLVPWELWLSEAQERMTVAVSPQKLKEFLDLCSRRDVEATVLGKFTDTGKIDVRYKGKSVVYLDMDFVHEGVPQMQLEAKWRKTSHREPRIPSRTDYTDVLKKILSSYTVCSKEWIIRQYDHEVQGHTVLKSLVGPGLDGPGDASVIQPLPYDKRGVAVSNGINPRYGQIDTYWMAASAIDEAVRNIVAVGGTVDQIAILDNFCWGNPIVSEENPDGSYKMAQLVRASQACYDIATAYGTPFISGKDSFHNEFEINGRLVSIPATLLISAMGIIPDVSKLVTMDVKKPGDIVYVVGETLSELGGSQFYEINGYIGKTPPRVNLNA